MTYPPSDRLLDLLGDSLVRSVLRVLLIAPATQKEVVAEVRSPQSSVSRAITLLQHAGVVHASEGRPAQISVRAREEAIALLLAVDHWADANIRLDADEQTARTAADRRLAIKDTSDPTAETEQP